MKERRPVLARVVVRSWIVPVVTLLAATVLGGCVIGPGYPRYGTPGYRSGYDHRASRPQDDHDRNRRDSPDHRYDDR